MFLCGFYVRSEIMENTNKKAGKSEEEKKENLELFKRAISEGLSLKFDEIAEELKDIKCPDTAGGTSWK